MDHRSHASVYIRTCQATKGASGKSVTAHSRGFGRAGMNDNERMCAQMTPGSRMNGNRSLRNVFPKLVLLLVMFCRITEHSHASEKSKQKKATNGNGKSQPMVPMSEKPV